MGNGNKLNEKGDELALSVNDYLRNNIRTVPDWPVAGVQFRDITPLLQDPRVFRVLIDAFVHRYMSPSMRPDVVAGLDARGFILGSVVAYELNVGFVPIRKKGKLPFTTVEETFELLQKLGAEVIEGAAIVDLPELGGSQKLRDAGLALFTLVNFEGH